MNNLNNLINNSAMILTALTAAFTGWQSYETRKSNQIENAYNKKNERYDRVKESIQKFDNKIISKLQKGTPSVRDAMKMLTYINRWSYYVSGDITDINIIKDALKPYLEIVSDTFGKAVLNLSKSNQDLLSNYINLMLELGLNPM